MFSSQHKHIGTEDLYPGCNIRDLPLFPAVSLVGQFWEDHHVECGGVARSSLV